MRIDLDAALIAVGAVLQGLGFWAFARTAQEEHRQLRAEFRDTSRRLSSMDQERRRQAATSTNLTRRIAVVLFVIGLALLAWGSADSLV